MLRLLPLAFLLPLAGCDLFNSILGNELELPIDLETPPQDFDVTGAIADVEGGACDTADSEECIALRAICETDDSIDCDANPQLPAEFPASVEVVPGDPPVEAAQLMADLGVTEATEMELAVPVDAAEELAEQGVQDNAAINAVEIGALAMAWPENSLTFDAPPLDLYISNEALEGVVNAEELIASGAVTKVGTCGLDIDGEPGIDVGQVAGSTDDVPVSFVEGGNEALSEAFKSGKFTLVTAVPDGKGFALKQKDGDANTLLKPTGAGKVALKATLVFKVSAADIVEAAE